MVLGAPLLFLYEVSIVVLIDFIAILITPGIFLTQIVNTNVYLIYFHSKNNIKMSFPQSWVLGKTQNVVGKKRGKRNCIDISKDFTTTYWWNIKKKKIIIIIL